MTDDLALLDRWVVGDPDAGQALVSRHMPAIHRFFHNKAPAAAEDLVQATFLACVEARSRFDRRASFRAYLFGIARNVLFRHYRTKHRRPNLDFNVTSLVDLAPSPSSAFARDERRALTQQALRAVPVDAQIILELFYWEGMRVRDIAAALEIAVGTVKSRLSRARAAFEGELDALRRPVFAASVRREMAEQDSRSRAE